MKKHSENTQGDKAMADVKWIKLTTDMFDNRKIKHLRKLPDGDSVVLIWVMLLTMAGRCNANGMIFLTENIPYTPKMLADELDFEENTVRMALDALAKLNMIVTDGDFFSIAGWEEYQNIEGMDRIREQNRIRKQRQREREKNLLQDSHVMSRDSHATDIEEEKEEEKEKENLIVSKDTIRCTDIQRVIDSWNSLGLSKIKKIVEGTDRYNWLRKRIKDYGIDEVLRAIDNVKKSEFLQNANFFSFDWMIRPNNFPKVLDGNYDNKNSPIMNKQTQEGRLDWIDDI